MPRQVLPEEGEIRTSLVILELDGEDAPAMLRYGGGPAHAPMGIGSAFDSKGIQRAARVFDPCSTAAEQPQAASVVEVTGIPRPVPWTAVHGEFGLVVTISMKVAGQHVIGANHNLTCHPRRQAGRREFRSGVWADRYAPLVSQDSKLD